MHPNVMKWFMIVGFIAVMTAAAPTSLEESTGRDTASEETANTQSRDGMTKLPSSTGNVKETKQKRDIGIGHSLESESSEYIPDSPARVGRDTGTQEPAVLKSTLSTSTEKFKDEKRDTTSEETENTQLQEEMIKLPYSKEGKLASPTTIGNTMETKQKREIGTGHSLESESSEYIPDSPARIARETGVQQQPSVLKSIISTSTEKANDEKRDTASEEMDDSQSEEETTVLPSSTKDKLASSTPITKENIKETKQKREIGTGHSLESESSEYIPDSPARVARETGIQQPTFLTSTLSTTTEKQTEKRDTDYTMKPDDNVQKPTSLENTTQKKPIVSTPLISTLSAPRNSRDVEGLYQADRIPPVPVTPATLDHNENVKSYVDVSYRNTNAEASQALRRPLSTIPEELHEHVKRSTKAQGFDYGKPRPGSPGNYRPGIGGPGNSRPGPGNDRPIYGPPGNNRPRPGSPGSRPRPGGPGNYRPGFGSNNRPGNRGP